MVPERATSIELVHVMHGLAADALGLAAGAAPAAPALTPRELEVLRLAERGHSVSEIGRSAYISDSTVKTHLRSVYRKLGARNRAAYQSRP